MCCIRRRGGKSSGPPGQALLSDHLRPLLCGGEHGHALHRITEEACLGVSGSSRSGACRIPLYLPDSAIGNAPGPRK